MPLSHGPGMSKSTHLWVLTDILHIIRRLRPVKEKLKRDSKSLADQLERAADSMALNLGEGNAVATGTARRASRGRSPARKKYGLR